MIFSPSVFFGVSELAIDLVLLLSKDEQHDDEHDQRALRGHVEAEREAENRNDDLVERHHEEVDDVAEEQPHTEMRQHPPGGLAPVLLFDGLAAGLSRGTIPLAALTGSRCG